jgi:hypothetical protein
MSHLKYETLINYLQDQLSAEARSEADAHLAGPCESCQRRLALAQTVLGSMPGDKTTLPPASVLKQAIDIPLTHPKPAGPGPWMRLLAALTFDSHMQLSSAMTRGAARERQMLFSAEQLDIDLQIKSAQKDHDLIGQVLGNPSLGNVVPVFVSLQRNTGQLLKATETDSLGQFAFRKIPSGVYDLIFDLENHEVAVMGIEVRND